MTNTHDQKTLRKFRRERAIGRYLLNPAVKVLSRLDGMGRLGPHCM